MSAFPCEICSIDCHQWILSYILEEEISAMKKELDKYGIQMPAFGKIGGILASEVHILHLRMIKKTTFFLCTI